MAFELPNLPYSHAALAARGMQQETLELHHDKHHQAYVTALNGFVEKTPDLQGKSLEEIVHMSHGKPDMAPVFNNAGQHWNHILFWENMSPNGGQIPGPLESKLTADFGSVQAFKDAFKAAAIGQFGSGWAWLVPRRRRQAQGHENPQRQQPPRHRRRHRPPRLRRLGAQLLPRLPQPPPRLRHQLARQASQLRIRRQQDAITQRNHSTCARARPGHPRRRNHPSLQSKSPPPSLANNQPPTHPNPTTVRVPGLDPGTHAVTKITSSRSNTRPQIHPPRITLQNQPNLPSPRPVLKVQLPLPSHQQLLMPLKINQPRQPILPRKPLHHPLPMLPNPPHQTRRNTNHSTCARARPGHPRRHPKPRLKKQYSATNPPTPDCSPKSTEPSKPATNA